MSEHLLKKGHALKKGAETMILEFILVHSMVLLGNGMHTVPRKKGHAIVYVACPFFFVA
jgi:hypothetical protein